ncbi:MAG: carbohydrate-binding protein [Myxococcota bacterium]|jgi:hypothetical protein|nr:carbohydrate-binding protein [Myxococcota bacterium]
MLRKFLSIGRLTLLSKLSLLLLFSVVLGCAEQPPAEDSGEPYQSAAAPLEIDGPVGVVDSGYWTRVLGCSGICVLELNFWVDLAVRNDAFQKDVGILWTADGWATVNTAHAVYEGPLEAGYERWGLDLSVGQYLSYSIPNEIEYAVFATMGGVTHWDPLNNYFIMKKVSREEPVRLLSSEVHMEAGQAVMTGAVRVFNLGFEKEVAIRYSLDDWQSWQEVPAEWDEREDWRFRIEGLGSTAALPSHVRFAVRYTVNGADYWDNNRNQDYEHKLAPSFQAGFSFADLSQAMSGILTESGQFVTDLPLSGMQARLGTGAWHEGSALTFSTEGLNDGEHFVEFELSLHGGGSVSELVPVQVENRLSPLQDWTPSAADGGVQVPLGTSWSATAAHDDLYVLSSGWLHNVVLRYDSFGAAAPVQVFDAFPTPSSVWTISVDPLRRVYGVDNNNAKLFRLGADGHLDASFGVGGVLSLSGNYAGQSICYPGDLEVDANHLFLLDTCNRRLLVFSHSGSLVTTVNMPDGSSYVPGALFLASDGLWVVQYDRLHLITSTTPGSFTISRTILLDFELNNVGGLTRTPDGRFWASHGHAALSVFGEDGELDGRWWGTTGGNASGLSGAFELPHVTELLPDGSVMVLGASGPQLVRFELDGL